MILIQKQINFDSNLDQDRNTRMVSNIEEAKETILDFSQGTVKVFKMSLYNLATVRSTISFYFNIISI